MLMDLDKKKVIELQVVHVCYIIGDFNGLYNQVLFPVAVPYVTIFIYNQNCISQCSAIGQKVQMLWNLKA